MRKEKGSALLIVFVFAAAIAIMLYKEMPVATFEAERQKEQLLIDRGNEYKRAVKLYVRKFQTFPPSIEALENTNRMRFLRSRYVDPYTGKAEWRLLHAGPGGIIMDSKIKQNRMGIPGAPGSVNGSNSFASNGSSFGSSSFGNSNNSSFGGSSFGNANNGSSAGFGNASFGNSGFGSANAGNQGFGTPNNSPLGNPNDANNNGFNNPAMMDNGFATLGMNGASGVPGASPFAGRRPAMAVNAAAPAPDQSGMTAVMPPDNQSGEPPIPMPPVPGQTGMQANFPNPQLGMQDPQTLAQNFAGANQNPQPTNQTGAFNNGNNNGGFNNNNGTFNNNNNGQNGNALGAAGQGNNVMGGGIAGIASKTAGHTIKLINEQKDRSLWEFVYDMQKEMQANAPGLGGAMGGAGANANGTGFNGGINNSQNSSQLPPGFVSPNQNNSFGSTNAPQAPTSATNPAPNQ